MLQKIQNYLVKPMTQGSSVAIGTVLVLVLAGVLLAVYMGWVKLTKKGW